MNKDFEEWLKQEFSLNFINIYRAVCWECWQASRKATLEEVCYRTIKDIQAELEELKNET